MTIASDRIARLHRATSFAVPVALALAAFALRYCTARLELLIVAVAVLELGCGLLLGMLLWCPVGLGQSYHKRSSGAFVRADPPGEYGGACLENGIADPVVALRSMPGPHRNSALATCAICLDDFESTGGPMAAARLPCGHTFHAHCVARWLQQGGGRLCPFRCQGDLAASVAAAGLDAAVATWAAPAPQQLRRRHRGVVAEHLPEDDAADFAASAARRAAAARVLAAVFFGPGRVKSGWLRWALQLLRPSLLLRMWP